MAAAAAWEFSRLAAAAGGGPVAILAIPGAELIAAGSYVFGYPLVLTALLFGSLTWSMLRYARGGEAHGWLWALGGAFYVGWPLLHFSLLHRLEQGREWVLLALLGTFACDTAAYAFGRLLGRRKLALAISPGKTWEGAIAGGVAATLAAPALAVLLGLPLHWTLWPLGLSLGVAAQVGDLVESMLKRSAGVKDASALVPGHGGVLDRLDSLVFAGPPVYYYSGYVGAG